MTNASGGAEVQSNRRHMGGQNDEVDGMDVIEIDLGRTAHWEAGALVLSWLAYPNGSDVALRDRYRLALCKTCLQYPALILGSGIDPAAIDPSYAALPMAKARAWSKAGSKKLRDREIAARMALPFLMQPKFGEAPTLPPGQRKLKVEEMAKIYRPQSGESDSDNVRKRAWARSKPVLALAVAFRLYGRWAQETFGLPGREEEIMLSPNVLVQVLALADGHEGHLLKALRVRPEQLVRFRLVGG